jgi:hypothetical protein
MSDGDAVGDVGKDDGWLRVASCGISIGGGAWQGCEGGAEEGARG